jgi:hypothetical protein
MKTRHVGRLLRPTAEELWNERHFSRDNRNGASHDHITLLISVARDSNYYRITVCITSMNTRRKRKRARGTLCRPPKIKSLAPVQSLISLSRPAGKVSCYCLHRRASHMAVDSSLRTMIWNNDIRFQTNPTYSVGQNAPVIWNRDDLDR